MKDKEGLVIKYRLTKADGSDVDPKGKYFVLKLNSRSAAHARASIAAARAYAASIRSSNLKLACDLSRECDAAEHSVSQRPRLLDVSTCYQCHHRDVLECTCLLSGGRKHPGPFGGIPAWCPLPEEKQ